VSIETQTSENTGENTMTLHEQRDAEIIQWRKDIEKSEAYKTVLARIADAQTELNDLGWGLIAIAAARTSLEQAVELLLKMEGIRPCSNS
jgi:hypothetical protein